jgi:hypothetical protein
MITKQFNDFEISPLAIRNREFEGFENDYLILDSLLRMYNPKSVFEIGTNFGTGTNIICNAVPNAKVYTLDLPFGYGDAPLYLGQIDFTGSKCKRPNTQLRGDSTTFDYSLYPCEFYYIDAEHTFENVFKETSSVLMLNPKVIAFHDTDIPEVMNAIEMACAAFLDMDKYDLIKVVDTRISYLILKDYK